MVPFSKGFLLPDRSFLYTTVLPSLEPNSCCRAGDDDNHFNRRRPRVSGSLIGGGQVRLEEMKKKQLTSSCVEILDEGKKDKEGRRKTRVGRRKQNVKKEKEKFRR